MAKKKEVIQEKEEEQLVTKRPALIKDFSIIKYLIVTEETQNMQREENALVFACDIKANKIQIKHAVESIFQAKVNSINTSIPPRKKKRVGRYTGYLPRYKKAIVRFDSTLDLGKISSQVAAEDRQANEN